LISMVRSIYKSIEKNLAHSRLNISWGVWTKLCTQYMERSRSSKVISQRSRKKIEFDIFVIAVSLCPTCNPIPLETFKYQKEEMIIVSGTQETKSLLTTKPKCVIQRSCQGLQHGGYPHLNSPKTYHSV
jgi:hypothetical protein